MQYGRIKILRKDIFISIYTLAINIRRLRIAKSMSQRALADNTGLSLPAIKTLELARTEPRIKTVQAIANALDARLLDLLRPVSQLRSVRLRSSRRMQNRENVLAEVARWLDDYVYLKKCLNERIPYKLKIILEKCSYKRIPEAAELCRKRLGLKPTEPIHDICGLLESAGVKVYSISMTTNSFFGLSVEEEDGGPAVVVNVWERISVEKRIFSAARELGHLILHPEAYDVAKVEENKQENQEADCFAGHFLMPSDGLRKQWNASAGLHLADRVFKVKSIFRVSYRTLLARLVEDEIADNSIWKKFKHDYQKRFNRVLIIRSDPMACESAEPFGLHKFNFCETRFRWMVKEAVEIDKISLSRGAEMLRIGLGEMRDLI